MNHHDSSTFKAYDSRFSGLRSQSSIISLVDREISPVFSRKIGKPTIQKPVEVEIVAHSTKDKDKKLDKTRKSQESMNQTG